MKEMSHAPAEAIVREKEDRSVPHLTNLNEDEQLSGKLFYSFEKEGVIRIGRRTGDPKPHIILSGIRIKENHATIEMI